MERNSLEQGIGGWTEKAADDALQSVPDQVVTALRRDLFLWRERSLARYHSTEKSITHTVLLDDPPTPMFTLLARFGDHIEVLGYDTEEVSGRYGKKDLAVTLYYRVLEGLQIRPSVLSKLSVVCELQVSTKSSKLTNSILVPVSIHRVVGRVVISFATVWYSVVSIKISATPCSPDSHSFQATVNQHCRYTSRLERRLAGPWASPQLKATNWSSLCCLRHREATKHRGYCESARPQISTSSRSKDGDACGCAKRILYVASSAWPTMMALAVWCSAGPLTRSNAEQWIELSLSIKVDLWHTSFPRVHEPISRTIPTAKN